MDTGNNNGPARRRCGEKTEIYSRVCGYFRPVANWNKGKKEEFRQRKAYNAPAAIAQSLEVE